MTAHTAEFLAHTLSTSQGADTAWVLIAAALVLLMTPGVAFFYGGLVQSRNTLSILLRCFLTICVVTVVWMLLGYSLAFGPSTMGGLVGDLKYTLLMGMEPADAVPDEGRSADRSPLFMVFMMMFAIISPAIIVGAIAERVKLIAFALFIPLWILIVYCPIVKWIWGNDPGETGFFALGNQGSLDFAGGTVIHLNAGIAALVAALVVRRRRTFGLPQARPHSIPLCVLGGALLWFGWFGFNAGNAGAPDHIAVLAFTNTQAAAAAAGLTWITIEWVCKRRPTVIGLISGVIAGLVAITPACGYVAPMWSLLIGAVAAGASYIAINGVKRWLAYDDSLDAFGIHGVAGFWGAIATGLFASLEINPDGRDGLFYGNPGQLWLQLKPTIYVIIWSGGCTWLLLLGIRKLVGLRATADQERVGLDLAEQNLYAYDIERDTPPAKESV